MKKENLSSLEIYMNIVFKNVIVAIPIIAVFAGITFTVIKLLGFYGEVSWLSLSLFDTSCLLYFVIGLIFRATCLDESGILKPKVIVRGKIFILLLVLIQWNFITYMIPSRDFWTYAFLFVAVVVFFFDSYLVSFAIAEIVISIGISWFIRPNDLLPLRNEYFIAEMILRIVLLFLGLSCLWLITYSLKKNLVSELEKIADFDTLTMLYNRRILDKSFDNAIENQKKTGNHFSIMMIDIDDFKIQNDKYGHSGGDEILKRIANIIRNTVSENGIVFRYGGEEILVIFYDDNKRSMECAEVIRERICNEKIVHGENEINSSVTIGVATFGQYDSVESLIKRADSNLYYGKNHGKNCVIN